MEVVKYRRWIRNCWFWDVVPTCRNVSRKEAKELRHQSICKAILRRNTSRQIVITTKEGTVAIISRKDAKGPRSKGINLQSNLPGRHTSSGCHADEGGNC